MKEFIIYCENSTFVKFILFEDDVVVDDYDIEYTYIDYEIKELNDKGYVRKYDKQEMEYKINELERMLKELKENYELYKEKELLK